MRLHQLPMRAIIGAYVLHSGIDKLQGDETTAAAVHGMAAGTYPLLKSLPPSRFLRLLAYGEIAVGTALLLPMVPAPVAGTLLTGFSGALVGLYMRTPGMRKPGSIWPTQQGIALSKDFWMLGVGLALVIEGLTARRGGD